MEMSKSGTQALIKNAIAQLEALSARIQPGACFDNQMQAESFFQFEDYLKAFDEIVTDTRIGLINEVRGWGNQVPMTRVDRKIIREKTADDRDDLLTDARDWADLGRHGEAA